MECLRCAKKDRLSRIKKLSLHIDGVKRTDAIGVTGIHCGHCGLLVLELHPNAVPVEAIEPISEPKPTGGN